MKILKKIKVLKTPNFKLLGRISLKERASELTQGLGGWKFEGWTVPAKLK